MSKRVKTKQPQADPEIFCSPPKKAKVAPSKGVVASPLPIVTPVAPRVAPNGYRLPDPLPSGEILTDSTKNQWMIGDSIGCGGFGEIYAAKPAGEKMDSWNYVIKIDHLNGPLYAEMYFYHRVAKEESIRNWMREKKLDFLGMPRYIASGIHDRRVLKKVGKSVTEAVTKYRFLVMQRFGDDLQKKLGEVNNTFDLKTSYTIANKVIDILEYIHSFGYIHADTKASNLLLGRSFAPSPRGKGLAEQQGLHTEVWLVDFGLVEKYRTNDGQHKSCEEDQRRANNGTVEFTSRDAHIGALSRRSDLEILAFNVLSWLSGGRLPWMSNLKDHKYVRDCKKIYMENLHDLFNYAFKKPGGISPPPSPPPPVTHSNGTTPDGHKQTKKSGMDKGKLTAKVPPGLMEFFQYIINLDFEQNPDYDLLKEILTRAIIKVDGHADGRFYFKKPHPKVVAKITSKMKRSSLSGPQVGRRGAKARVYSDESTEDDELMEVEFEPNKRKARKNGSVAQESPILTTPKKNLKDPKGRSKSVSPLKKKRTTSLSAPTSMTPHKTPAAAPAKSPFDKPTPAMVEVMQRIKEKHKLQANGHHSSPKNGHKNGSISHLLTTAAAAVAKSLASSGVATNGTIVKKRGRPPKTTTAAAAVLPPVVVPAAKNRARSESKSSKVPVVNGAKGRPIVSPKKVSPSSSSATIRPLGKQLSSTSSTHSTKENKASQHQPGVRRSPRIIK